MPTMDVVIPDEIVQATHLSPEDLLVDIAVWLFEQRRLTLGQAARLTGMSQPDFQHLLGRRKISLHYGVEDFEADLRTIAKPRDQ